MQNLLIFLIFTGIVVGVARVFAAAAMWFYSQVVSAVARANSPVISESDIFADEAKAKAEASVLRKTLVNKLPARMGRAVPQLSSKEIAWAAAQEQHDLDNAFYETLDSPAYLRRGLIF